jgi:hypothetical protein
MSTNTPQNQDDQEIDLSQISKKIGEFFEGVSRLIFNAIQFFIKKRKIIIILLLAGIGIGVFLDYADRRYESQISVTPNFDSTDYLYSKVQLIQSKIQEGDTVFIKDVVGIDKPKLLKVIIIRPITDIYKFIGNKTENFELIKLLAEDEDINTVLEAKLTSKNYRFHTITIVTNGVTSDKATIQPLLSYLNKSDYFNKVRETVVKNTEIKMDQNDIIISQINNVLNNFSDKSNGAQKSDRLIYYNENTQLNDVIKTKEGLVSEQGILKLSLLDYDKIIKDYSYKLNYENLDGLDGKLKFILPIFFIFVFVIYTIFLAFYRKQKLKVQLNLIPQLKK